MTPKSRGKPDPDERIHIHEPGTFPATGKNVAFSVNGKAITGRFQATLLWDVAESPRDIVIHLSAFLLDEDDKVPKRNPYYCVNHDNDRSKDGSTERRGRRKHGHAITDEQITVDLNIVDEDVMKIVFVAYIQDAILLKHSFGAVKGGVVTLRQLGEDSIEQSLPDQLLNGDYFEAETAVVIGELYRRDTGHRWAYRDISQGWADIVEVGHEFGVLFVSNE